MFKLSLCLILVCIWKAPRVENFLLADIFKLVGSILQFRSPFRSSGSENRLAYNPIPLDVQACFFSSNNTNLTTFVECGYCDKDANEEVRIVNDNYCAQQCHSYKCAIYKDDDFAGCLSHRRDQCQCGGPEFKKPRDYVIEDPVKRKKARDTPAGNCTKQ